MTNMQWYQLKKKRDKLSETALLEKDGKKKKRGCIYDNRKKKENSKKKNELCRSLKKKQ